MNTSETGIKLIAYGVESYFKPWYFDGKVVYWGNPEQTESGALAAAQELKAFFLDRLK
uniref:Uncharacterized protein n=1 Tax=Synechococcus phage S-CAM8 TaxID=754038 RepID=G8EY26_9CAUD